MGKALPKLAAVSLCLLSLTGCVSRGEPGPAFPESYSPAGPEVGSANPASGPRSPGFAPAPTETGPWAGFVTAMTENPVARTIKSAGQKTAETLTPKPHEEAEYDAVSLNNPPPKADAAMFVSMAQVHEAGNNLDAAAQTYEKALQLNKGHVPAIVGLAQVRFRQQRHDEAYQLFTQARKIDPHNLPAMLGQAHYHDTRENMPEASRLYTEATQRHPESATAWNDLGLCLARQGRLPESQQTLQRAVQLDPANVLYRNNVATVLVELKRNDEALAHLQQAHGRAPGHYNLGFLLHRRGEDRAAAEQFNLALRVDPSFEPARQWLEKLNSQGGSQRAGRPPMGRAAAMLPGPDGRNLPLLAKNARRSKGPMAPPEIEHLDESGPWDAIVESEAARSHDEKSMESEAENVELAVSTTDSLESGDRVVPVAAVEISDDSESALENEPIPVPIRRVRVNRAYEAVADQESVVRKSNSSLAGNHLHDKSPETSNARSVKLLQPRMISGEKNAGTSNSVPASELPAAISQLQIADEDDLQLKTPPTGELNEPYYEPTSDFEKYRAESKAEAAFANRPVSLYEPAATQPSARSASDAIEPAAPRHGWKKVRVEW